MSIRKRQIVLATILSLGIMTFQAQAQFKVCQKVTGTMMETVIPAESAPNDPFGRILGAFSGNFAGVTNASLTAFLITPPAISPGFPVPTQIMQVRHAFLTGPGDVVTTLGKTVFNLAPSMQPGQFTAPTAACPAAPCVVENPQVLDVTGGTGRWTGASGQLRNLGLGNLNLAQGQGVFTFVVAGEICLPASSNSGSSPENAPPVSAQLQQKEPSK